MKITFTENEINAMVESTTRLIGYDCDNTEEDLKLSGYTKDSSGDYYFEIDESVLVNAYKTLTPEIVDDVESFQAKCIEAVLNIYDETTFTEPTKEWLMNVMQNFMVLFNR